MSTASHRLERDVEDRYQAFDRFEEDELDPAEIAMRTHVRVIGVIHLVMASGLVIAAMIVALAIGGGGLLSGDARTIGITTTTALGINVVLLSLAAPGLFTGFGLLGLRPWARVLAIVLGVIHLPGFPMGTAFGVYSLWALTHADSTPIFRHHR
jgi:hypothetical protein